MKSRRLLPLLLALLILSACNAPAADSSPDCPSASPDPQSPPPSVSWNVVTHWDVLDQPEKTGAVANRLSGGPLPELLPSDSYGAIVPYVGGELDVLEPWLDQDGNRSYYTSYLYGLCTAGGLILTDPVYLAVIQPTWYDSCTGVSRSLPVWLLTQITQDEDGEYYTAVGLAAQDGSWYTGMRYETGLSYILASCGHSVLLMESDDTAVLVSLADGSELARYSPYDFLTEDASDYAEWFFREPLIFGMAAGFKDYFRYDPQSSGIPGRTVWIDGATGEILDEAPSDLPDDTLTAGRVYFANGWYERKGVSLVIHYTDGSTETLDFSDRSLGTLSNISPDFLLFWDGASTTLTDHQGNIIATDGQNRDLYLAFDQMDGSAYSRIVEYSEEDNFDWCHITYLNADGSTMIEFETALNWINPSAGLLPIVDGETYRLIDLRNEGRELIRLPRWPGMDFPADD